MYLPIAILPNVFDAIGDFVEEAYRRKDKKRPNSIDHTYFTGNSPLYSLPQKRAGNFKTYVTLEGLNGLDVDRFHPPVAKADKTLAWEYSISFNTLSQKTDYTLINFCVDKTHTEALSKLGLFELFKYISGYSYYTILADNVVKGFDLTSFLGGLFRGSGNLDVDFDTEELMADILSSLSHRQRFGYLAEDSPYLSFLFEEQTFSRKKFEAVKKIVDLDQWVAKMQYRGHIAQQEDGKLVWKIEPKYVQRVTDEFKRFKLLTPYIHYTEMDLTYYNPPNLK